MSEPTAPDASADPWPVAAALEIVDESGFEALSVRSVAAHAGYTPMAVYRHVADADELRRRVVRRIFEEWESRVYSVLDAREPMARLWKYARVYREYAVRRPHRYEVLFELGHGLGTHRFPGGFRDSPATTFEVLVDSVGEAMERGELEADDPVEVALLFWSTAHGLVTLRRSGRFDDGAEFGAFYRRSLGRLLRAMGGSTPEGGVGADPAGERGPVPGRGT